MPHTRVLVISDTHGEDLDYSKLPPVDVAIHCGDLTEESKLEEFRSAIRILHTIKASTKLVIAGNHDFTLDQPTFKQKLGSAQGSIDPALVKKTYGEFGEAEGLLNGETTIKYLHEGTHSLELPNGALLTVYASPHTASKSDWGFAYDPAIDHDWNIELNTDIAITHSPPRGVLDYTDARERAGSPSLFAAIAAARPQLHCFGHIHESWGAKSIAWRDLPEGEIPSHFTAIDNDRSQVMETLATLSRGKFDSPEIAEEKALRRQAYEEQGYCGASKVVPGGQTLFVNAAIESEAEDKPHHLPWIVDLDLPSSQR